MVVSFVLSVPSINTNPLFSILTATILVQFLHFFGGLWSRSPWPHSFLHHISPFKTKARLFPRAYETLSDVNPSAPVTSPPTVLTFDLRASATGFSSKFLNMLCALEMYQTQGCVPNTVRTNEPNHESLEHRKVYFRTMQGEQVVCAHKPQTPQWFSGSFYKQNLGWGLQSVWFSSDWLVVR